MSEDPWLRRFVLNEHLDVVLDRNGRTMILLDGEEYLMCKRLVLNIKLDEVPAYQEISSIDDAAEQHATLYRGRGFEPGFREITITPEEEFQGHCSNLQAWVDHDYDTRILHSNMSFNLLRGLAEVGDEKAARVLETEIMDRARNASKMTAIAILSTFADKQLSPAVFHAFIDNPETQIRILIAKQPKLPADALDRLVADDDVLVRRAVAERIDLPEDAITRLLADDDEIVRSSMKEVNITYRGTILATVPPFIDRLDLSRKGIESIAEIEGLDRLLNLKKLILTNNNITRIESLDLSNLVTLENLSLSFNSITRIEGLENLVNLVDLSISKNQISTIEGLDNLIKLRELRLYGNQIAKIEGLNHLGLLSFLLLQRNKIEKIEGIDSLFNLSLLDLSDNYITKIEGLDFQGPLVNTYRTNKDPFLVNLNLSNNQITKIEGLDAVVHLYWLNLAKNWITAIEGLDNLQNLHFVNLSGNTESLAPDDWFAWPRKDGPSPDG